MTTEQKLNENQGYLFCLQDLTRFITNYYTAYKVGPSALEIHEQFTMPKIADCKKVTDQIGLELGAISRD
jgi:hypothetical protein